MGFEEDRILRPRPFLCPALPAIHEKLFNNCTALLCPNVKTGMALKLSLALEYSWRGQTKSTGSAAWPRVLFHSD